MYNFVKFFYGLLFISICSFDLTATIDTVRTASKNDTAAPATVHDVSKSSVSIAAEGGNVSPSVPHDKTHLGRENVIDKPDLLPKTFNNTTNKTVDIFEEKPVNENSHEIELGISKKNDNTSVVPKKGALDGNFTSTITNTSTKINVTGSTAQPNVTSDIRPKKPMITIHGDESLAPSGAAKFNRSDLRFNDKKSNRSDYVIPIVAVILSVPLVAIIISMLYKRGMYWWQHRNYRRMDFLIEGMYNN